MALAHASACTAIRLRLCLQFFHIEDILLGQYSLRGGATPELRKYLKNKAFTLGKQAPKVEGIRVIPTSDDELLLDLTAVWGSSMQVRQERPWAEGRRGEGHGPCQATAGRCRAMQAYIRAEGCEVKAYGRVQACMHGHSLRHRAWGWGEGISAHCVSHAMDGTLVAASPARDAPPTPPACVCVQFNVGAVLRIGPLRLYVPLDLSDVSFRVRAAPHRTTPHAPPRTTPPRMHHPACTTPHLQLASVDRMADDAAGLALVPLAVGCADAVRSLLPMLGSLGQPVA